MALTEKEITGLKEQLEKESAELEVQLKEEKKPADFGSDVDSFEEEEDETEEEAKQLGVQEILKGRLEDIEHALDKILKGGYGACEKCGQEIDLGLLKVNPESRLCKNCKTAVKA